MDLIKMALDADFLLFIIGIFLMDIARYIQKRIATCNPTLFGFALAILIYFFIKAFVS